MPESIPGGSREPVKPRLDDPLEVERSVNVQRSSGKIEGGWTISAFTNDPEVGVVAVVQKPSGLGVDQVLTKRIPLKKLEALNPPEQK